MQDNLLIEASAGTGKTQALGERIISLIKAGLKPEQIVALTFSRAAAGEIFERLVMLLAERKDAKTLRAVIAAQHLSQIGTLDGFLLRATRAFPIESTLRGELRLMDEYEAKCALNKVTFSLLRQTDKALRKRFVEAFFLTTNRENARSFVEAYRAFIHKWHRLITAMNDDHAWGEAKTIWGKEPAFVHITEKELSIAADRLEGCFDTSAWEDFVKWIRAFRGSLSVGKGIAKKILDDESLFVGDIYTFTFSRKTYTLTREATLRLREAMICVYGYVLRKSLELARGVYELVSEFERCYQKTVRTKGQLVFDDIPRLFAALPPVARAELEYRMDAKLGAWAIDEFQDTSQEQWRAIGNLVEEAKQSDGEKSVFIVGDIKQAIYGWRNGDVEIFKCERASGAYKIGELTQSFRSAPAIIEAVNRVFAQGRIKQDFPTWECPEHESARKDLTGFVRVMDASGGKMDNFVEGVKVALEANVKPGISTAILVRNNTFGKFLAERLKLAGLKNVVWEGESDILTTPALSGFLDLLHLSDHPGDMMVYRHFKMTPLCQAKYPKGVPSIDEVSREMALNFTTRGIVRTLRELRALLPTSPQEAWDLYTEERFADMLKAAGEFELLRKEDALLSDFVSFLQSKQRRDIAEPGKIKILTIHRSKGLGFDYVVLPLYEREGITAETKDALVGDNWVLPNIDHRVAKAVGGLEKAYTLRKNRVEQEALCTYYVAMTRAKKGLTMILHPAPIKSESLRFSDIVRSAELGDLANVEVKLNADADGEDKTSVHLDPTHSTISRSKREIIKRKLPSELFSDGIEASELFRVDGGRKLAMARGEAAHKQMESVEWTAELPKPEGFVELWREKAFEVFEDGKWISGRMDRVVFFKNANGLNAEIIDFKSSLAHKERYDRQLEAYRQAVHALTNIPLSRITARLMKRQCKCFFCKFAPSS